MHYTVTNCKNIYMYALNRNLFFKCFKRMKVANATLYPLSYWNTIICILYLLCSNDGDLYVMFIQLPSHHNDHNIMSYLEDFLSKYNDELKCNLLVACIQSPTETFNLYY